MSLTVRVTAVLHAELAQNYECTLHTLCSPPEYTCIRVRDRLLLFTFETIAVDKPKVHLDSAF